ncbi:MAG: XdhC family protein [Bryobacteraceae bacterium]
MFDEFLAKVAEARSRGESFATALVVRYEAPVSGKPGDKAIIFRDGRIWGWTGGGCVQSTVVKEALNALESGIPRLIRIRPSPHSESEAGVIEYAMACHSGGSLDIFIEPVLPKPQIVIFGRSVVAQVLARLGKAVGYNVTAIAPGVSREDFPDADRIEEEIETAHLPSSPHTFVVVSTQGQQDEEALEQAFAMDVPYVAFVASKMKTGKVFESLRGKGIGSERLSKIHAPAGLDIGAVSPEGIAVSILAEIVQAGGKKTPSTLPVVTSQEAKDPICGMTVDPHRAKYKSEYDGATFYFCCAHCKQAFDKQCETASDLLGTGFGV